MLSIALGLGVVAIVFWIWRKQSVRKGLGFTFHWWVFGDFSAGVLVAAIAMTLVFLIELAIGAIQVTGFSFDLATLSARAGWFVYGAFFEEFIFRSLMLSGIVAVLMLLAYVRLKLSPGLIKWLAIAISAAAFGYAHFNNPGATAITIFGTGLGGLMYGVAFLGGRNIWLPVGLHFGWNFFQGNIFGFPVSGTIEPSLILQQAVGADVWTGGAYGPEAGLIGMASRFVVIALLLYYLYWRSHRKGSIERLDFPIKIYDNPSRREQEQQRASSDAQLTF
ncbi:MAG: CPBP family intramembrane glutamic endopeptidase [Caldilinea sp.]